MVNASATAARLGLQQPCAAQLRYSLVERSSIEDGAMVDALTRCGASVVASFSLAGGILTGKYQINPKAGCAAGTLEDARAAAAMAAAARLVNSPQPSTRVLPRWPSPSRSGIRPSQASYSALRPRSKFIRTPPPSQ
jgi:aryl-alcohol dehydrogenase-like predicted oxidoreductase